MNVLKDIIKWSNYKPKGGLKGELYNLVEKRNYDSNEVKDHFKSIGKLNQLPAVNMRLKESLLGAVLTMPLYTVKKSVRNRIRLLRKELQARVLLYIGSRVAGTKLAIDTIVVAEQNEEFEIVHRLCRELINQFSNSQPDAAKYRKYRLKIDIMEGYIQDELKVEKVYRDIAHHNHTKKSVGHFSEAIKEFDKIQDTNTNFKFNFFLYSLKNVYYQLTNDPKNLIINNKAAYAFFEALQLDVHYITKLNFISALVPYYIINKQYGQAETTINTCLEMPIKGSYNWHRILIYQSILGFYSGKPKMSLRAYKLAHALQKKFKNEKIAEYWHLISGYLALFKKLNGEKENLDQNSYQPFKLRKYLNIKEEKRNDVQKANLIILELLHLLVDDKHSEYLEKLGRVEGFIQSRFKAHQFKRTRYFLRLLKSVVKGNYHVPLVEAHGKRQLKNLAATRKDLTIETIDLEIVPYELLWDIVINRLRR